MGDYALKTKDGEVINTIQATCIEEAEEILAKMKQLTIEELTKIYIVEKVS